MQHKDSILAFMSRGIGGRLGLAPLCRYILNRLFLTPAIRSPKTRKYTPLAIVMMAAMTLSNASGAESIPATLHPMSGCG
jgi:hypothetical protein